MNGTVYHDPRRGRWYCRYKSADGRRPSVPLGQHPNKKAAKRYALSLPEPKNESSRATTFEEVAGRYIKERMPTRYSTARAYRSWLNNYILPRWRDVAIGEIRAQHVEPWLLSLDIGQKSKVHIRDVMVHVLKAAMFWEMLEYREKPFDGMKIEGASRRENPPRILTAEEFGSLLQWLSEPYRTMTLIAQCLGLRFSELIALQWEDVDWLGKRLLIERAAVNQKVGPVKSEYSKRPVPLDDTLVEALKRHHVASELKAGWMWASPSSAYEKPYSYTWLSSVLDDAAIQAGLGRIGWHTFRHTYRSWLDSTGAALGVQQKLMRHADIRTTMNTYGGALPKDLREAHGRVVRMAVPQ